MRAPALALVLAGVVAAGWSATTCRGKTRAWRRAGACALRRCRKGAAGHAWRSPSGAELLQHGGAQLQAGRVCGRWRQRRQPRRASLCIRA